MHPVGREIHVVAHVRGGWEVRCDDSAQPLSAHVSETDAERAAMTAARARHARYVVVHDRYQRVRTINLLAGWSTDTRARRRSR